ncbi:unnamed protein product [Mesocestoides corti]|uniref:tRNA (guanine(10)-N(2))-methyltransferase n=1 Tax=Mesocestoides corti TaxID=53468 RepID=A0A0R3UPU5_MESCO|nr:unnamed protein product [Mesocestoides corti]
MDYLLAFSAHEFINFRELEVRSLLELNGLSQDCVPCETNWTAPYISIQLPNDAVAAKLIERSVLVKSIYSIWTTASCFDELLSKVPNFPRTFIDKYLYGSESYKIIISSVNKRVPQDDRMLYIRRLIDAHVGATSPVSLDNPTNQIHVIFEFTKAKAHNKDQSLVRIYYGRLVGESSRKRLLSEFDLSKRTYLGNTTMDVRLAGIIANACLCSHGDIVWDPFIGTGGMVLAASVWGAFGAGNDIDYSLVHGLGASPKAGQGKRMSGECLRANYKQYNLQSRYLDVIIADAASLVALLRNPNERLLPEASQSVAPATGLFDAIITDPPYGVRERSCRVASEAVEKEPSLQTEAYINMITGGKQFAMVPNKDGLVPVPHDLPHYPHKENYPLQETFGDLLRIAERFLKPKGRLVFWVPVSKSNYTGPSSLPAHPRLKLVAVCEQALNSRISRFLMVMEKLAAEEPDFCLSAETLNETVDDDGVMTNPSIRGIPFHLKNFRETYFQQRANR